MNVLLYNPTVHGRKVNRDLMYGCWCLGNRVANIVLPNLALASIGTVLKNEGYDENVIDENVEGEKKSLEIALFHFDAVIILTNTITFHNDCKKIEELKNIQPQITAIFCGQHITAVPESIKNTPVDIGVLGEPELVIKELIKVLEKKWPIDKLQGIVWKDNNGQCKNNGPGPMVKNLDNLPVPDRSLLPKGGYFHPLARRGPFTTIISSRGCKGNCVFCTSPFFYRNTYRKRSAENVLYELRLLYKTGYREILFRDEVFTLDNDRLQKICKGLINEKLRLSWMCNTRVGRINRDTMRLIKKAGCHTLMCGVESGDPEILKQIKKGIHIDRGIQMFKDAKKTGLSTHAHFLVGNPCETRTSILNTLHLLKKIKPTTIDIGIVVPYPGSGLYKTMKKSIPALGDATSLGIDNIHMNSFFNEKICELEPEELSQTIKKLYKEFYCWPQTWWNNLLACTTPKAFVNKIMSALSIARLFNMVKYGRYLKWGV